jgi:hypothetical protein
MTSAIRSELHRLADQIDDDHVEAAFKFLSRLADEDHSPDSSTTNGNQNTHPANDPPLWGIAGIGRSGEASDIAKHKDAYLADAYGRKDG